MESNWKTIK